MRKVGDKAKEMMKHIMSDKISPCAKVIIKYWILRTRFQRLLRIQVQSLIELNIQPECLFCRNEYGLQVELVQSLEDMFFDYLNENNLTLDTYDYRLWMKHFREEARYRTLCTVCYDKLEQVHKYLKKKAR